MRVRGGGEKDERRGPGGDLPTLASTANWPERPVLPGRRPWGPGLLGERDHQGPLGSRVML